MDYDFYIILLNRYKSQPISLDVTDRSMLFLALSGGSVPLIDFSEQSTLFLDFSLLSVLGLDFSLRSTLSLGFSAWSEVGLHFSLRSVLNMGVSLKSVLFRGSPDGSIIRPDPFLRCDFSMTDMNFLRCFIYSG